MCSLMFAMWYIKRIVIHTMYHVLYVCMVYHLLYMIHKSLYKAIFEIAKSPCLRIVLVFLTAASWCSLRCICLTWYSIKHNGWLKWPELGFFQYCWLCWILNNFSKFKSRTAYYVTVIFGVKRDNPIVFKSALAGSAPDLKLAVVGSKILHWNIS